MASLVSRRSLLALAGCIAAEGRGVALCSPGMAAAEEAAKGGVPDRVPAARQREVGRSGLPWMSGMCGSRITGKAAEEIDGQEEYRGRRLDVQTTFSHWRKGWEGWVDAPFWRAGLPEVLAERGIRVSHSTPLLCAGSEGRFDECARGEFDQYHRTVARRWGEIGHPAPIIRLGWEATHKGYPWNALQDPTPGYQRYKDAFRRVADVYRRELPGCEIDWNNLRRPRADITKLYPGDDWVDIVGADIYCNEPMLETDDAWEAFANGLDRSGGPAGPVPYLEFAASRGKRFGVAEWGVTNVDGTPNSPYDSGRYVRGMWEFFDRHRDELRYECYYNRDGDNGDHRIHPPDRNPRASAAYGALWRP